MPSTFNFSFEHNKEIIAVNKVSNNKEQNSCCYYLGIADTKILGLSNFRDIPIRDGNGIGSNHLSKEIAILESI